MVMDATQSQQPSPQSVGREFVRQYYTLLNKAPNHLHRFYNNNSSFIHGESTLVVGQKNIHNRIQQLNFHDCHAKISQVDAQATLGNGVVVQVTGELSNDGQPMRRFTQTFVLVAQSPKKYYVHNDIFRYQDVYSDEENDGESRSENDEDHEQTVGNVPTNEQQSSVAAVVAEQQQQQQHQQLPTPVVAAATGVLPQQQAQGGAPQQQAIYYSMPPTAGGRAVTVLAAPQGGAAVQLGGQYAATSAAGVHPQQVQATAPVVTQLNGVVGHDDLLQGMQQPSAVQQQPLVAQTVSPVVQSAATVPVAGTAVLAAQTPAGVATLPVANAATAMPGFTQSPMLQQQLLQQQQQPQQQPLPNAVSQPVLLQSQAAPHQISNNADLDETISSNTVTLSPSTNASSTETSPRIMAAVTSPSAPEPVSAPIVDDFKTINEQQQQEKYEAAKQQQHQQSEQRTYANLFKSTSSSPSGFVNAAMQQQQQLQQQQQQLQQHSYQTNATISTTTFSQSNSTTPMSVYNSRSSDNTSSLRMDNNNMGSSSQGGPLPQRSTARINKDFEPRRTSNAQQFGDSQQLFLGNIPHHASEDDLKQIFGRFGNVVELRVLSKSGGKLQPGARNPLNYGFITYEDAESVQKCLAHCPLYFPENSPDGQKLNVEEKKPRTRPNDMPPRQPMGGGANSMNNNMTNSQRTNMSGGPPSRSLSNSGSGSGGGGMMRGSNTTNSMSRGGSSGGGARIGGAFNRNENRSGGPSNGGGPQVRGGNNNAQSGGGSYAGRR